MSEESNFNKQYLDLLVLIGGLSKIFSDNDTPYINYRVAENLYCKFNNAINLSRSDVAYDAKIGTLGIGIKTFIADSKMSDQKISEFNKLSSVINGLDGRDLAEKVSQFRNERIDLANRLYGIENSIYHIIARSKGQFNVFDTPYPHIDIDKIVVTNTNNKTIKFNDGIGEYTYNRSKSTLFKRFEMPVVTTVLDVDIIEDPYSLLSELLYKEHKDFTPINILQKGVNYIVLPLYSPKIDKVSERSGLNQWNALGRERNFNEVYIPIPVNYHRKYPDFFPRQDTPFELYLPNGKKMNVKVCQQGGKALMSNPNRELGAWLLRDVMKLKNGELLTKEKLDALGFDSVVIRKNGIGDFSIDISSTEKFTEFNSDLE